MKFISLYRSVFQKIGQDSTSDWYRALFLLVIALCIMFIVNIFFYIRFTQSQNVASESNDTKTIILKQSDIQNAIKSIEQHDVPLNRIPRIVESDPSF